MMMLMMLYKVVLTVTSTLTAMRIHNWFVELHFQNLRSFLEFVCDRRMKFPSAKITFILVEC